MARVGCIQQNASATWSVLCFFSYVFDWISAGLLVKQFWRCLWRRGLVVFQLHSLQGIYYQGKQFTVNTLFSGLSTNLNRSETNPHRSKRLFRLVPLLIPFANSSEPVRFFSIKVPCSVRTKLRYRQAEQHLCFLIGNLLLERTQFSFESQAFDEFWQELSDIGFRPPTEMNCNSKIGQKLQLKTLTMSGVEGLRPKTLCSRGTFTNISGLLQRFVPRLH